MSSEVEHNCPNCGRACKDKRGMSIHLKKCQLEIDRSSTCKYCNLAFSSIYTLERHLNTCVEFRVFKITKECEEKLSKTKQEYELKLEQTTSSLHLSHQTQKNLLEYQLDNYRKEGHLLGQEINTLKAILIQEQKDHNHDKEVWTKEKETILRDLNESKTLISKLIHTVADNRQGVTTINNTNNNTNHTIQVYNFNPSKFRGIFPVSRLITSEEQIVRQLLNKGLTDYYRITDKSRGTIMWIDSDGNEIRDAGAQTLTSHLYDTIKEEFEAQKEYSSKKLDQPDLDVDEHNKYVKSMKVSNRVITKDKDSMIMIGKQLSKSGKNKTDTSIIGSSPTSYFIKFNSIVGDRLVSNCIDWLWMDLYDFGNYLYREISDLVTYRSSPTINKPHFIIHDDQKNDYSVYSSSFSSLLYNCLEKNIFSNSYEIITKIIAQMGISTNTSETSPVLEWLYEPTQDQNETVFRQFLITSV